MPRQTFDVTRTLEEVVGLVTPIIPATTSLHRVISGPVYVTADSDGNVSCSIWRPFKAGQVSTYSELRNCHCACEENPVNE